MDIFSSFKIAEVHSAAPENSIVEIEAEYKIIPQTLCLHDDCQLCAEEPEPAASAKFYSVRFSDSGTSKLWTLDIDAFTAQFISLLKGYEETDDFTDEVKNAVGEEVALYCENLLIIDTLDVVDKYDMKGVEQKALLETVRLIAMEHDLIAVIPDNSQSDLYRDMGFSELSNGIFIKSLVSSNLRF